MRGYRYMDRNKSRTTKVNLIFPNPEKKKPPRGSGEGVKRESGGWGTLRVAYRPQQQEQEQEE